MKYKTYNQNQSLLLPPDLRELIAEDDLCMIVDRFVNALKPERLEGHFREDVFGRGQPPFNPRMMLKVILYAYSRKMLSCREMERSLSENIKFMYLAAMQRPDFRTINRFRGLYLRNCLDEVFADLVKYLMKKGHIRDEDYFIDGTKIAANARKYSALWRKNTQRFEQRVKERAIEVLNEADRINDPVDESDGSGQKPAEESSEPIDSQGLRKKADELEERATEAEKKEARALRKAHKQLRREADKLEEYEKQKERLGSRNSYSKTDPDATMMRMKGTDELRPGYNLQIGVQDSFITGVSVSNNANDASCLIEHLKGRQDVGLELPPRMVADAGYGSEENYAYVQSEGVEAYVKYPGWYRQQKGKLKPFQKASFVYDSDEDRFICPRGEILSLRETTRRTLGSGYEVELSCYECNSTATCPLKEQCTRGKKRTIHHSHKLDQYQKRARDRLASTTGIQLRKKRGHRSETVFGHLKHNWGYQRTHFRGMPKVAAEALYLAIAYNLQKLHHKTTTGLETFKIALKGHFLVFNRVLQRVFFRCGCFLENIFNGPGAPISGGV